MSTKRFPGQKVLLKPRAGFGGPEHGSKGLIHLNDLEEPESCMLCGNKDCSEWPSVELLNEGGKKTGKFIHHVSECEIADYPKARKKAAV